MAFKFIALFALVAAANAIAIPVHSYGHEHVEHHAPAHYDFAYSVHDGHTGDIKSQHESRKGDAVHGSYSLIDSDGYKRTVEYTADDHHGFNAVVHREPTHVKIPVPVHKAVHIAAPVHHVVSAPIHHIAPAVHHVQQVHHVAPVVHHVAAPVSHSYGHSHVSVHGAHAAYHY